MGKIIKFYISLRSEEDAHRLRDFLLQRGMAFRVARYNGRRKTRLCRFCLEPLLKEHPSVPYHRECARKHISAEIRRHIAEYGRPPPVESAVGRLCQSIFGIKPKLGIACGVDRGGFNIDYSYTIHMSMPFPVHLLSFHGGDTEHRAVQIFCFLLCLYMYKHEGKPF